MKLFYVGISFGILLLVGAFFSKDPESVGTLTVAALLFIGMGIISTTRR